MLTIEQGTAEERAYLDVKLGEFNANKVAYTQSEAVEYIDFSLKDATGAIVGGLNAIAYGWRIIYVNVLWIDQRYRHGSYGTQLLNHLQTAAENMDCHLIHLDTFDFQAKDFYLKNGYEIFGELDDCPPGHKRFYLKKIV
jgi:GNAT superfamily N-acetyltransferase